MIYQEITMSVAQIWQITSSTNKEIQLKDQSSLDAITRQLPEGYYSTFRTFGNCTQVLGLTAHLRRLYEPVPASRVDEHSLRRQLRALLEPYRPNEARVRMVMTRGGQAYIAIEPLKPLPREVYENGVRVETTELQRQHPSLKSTSFIGRSDPERNHIAQEGIFEALLVKEGIILEGMTSNFFYVVRRDEHASTAFVAANAPHSAQREEVLCTARDDILLGITRETVIEIARGRGLEVSYEPLRRDQVTAAAEAFITSSSRGIVPVIQIDHTAVGQGSPGTITKELMSAYETYVLENAESI